MKVGPPEIGKHTGITSKDMQASLSLLNVSLDQIASFAEDYLDEPEK